MDDSGNDDKKSEQVSFQLVVSVMTTAEVVGVIETDAEGYVTKISYTLSQVPQLDLHGALIGESTKFPDDLKQVLVKGGAHRTLASAYADSKPKIPGSDSRFVEGLPVTPTKLN